MDDLPTAQDTAHMLPPGARERLALRFVHRRGSLIAASVAVGAAMAALSLGLCSLAYWLAELHARDTITAIAMYGLPFLLPLTLAPIFVYQLLRISGTLSLRTQQLESEVARRRAAEHRLEILATVDDLTQVANRRAFFAGAGGVAEAGDIACIGVLDLDNFKILNDTFGHAAGDDALRHVGRLLAHTLPKGSIVGRLGGEEFGIVLPGHTLDSARAVLDVIRDATPGVRPGLTASIGLTNWEPSDGDTIDSALARADGALYRAKQHGRNRVESLARDQAGQLVSEFSPLARRD